MGQEPNYTLKLKLKYDNWIKQLKQTLKEEKRIAKLLNKQTSYKLLRLEKKPLGRRHRILGPDKNIFF